MARNCSCGCDTFRLKSENTEEFYTTVCKNCNHTLAEHVAEVRSHQAE